MSTSKVDPPVHNCRIAVNLRKDFQNGRQYHDDVFEKWIASNSTKFVMKQVFPNMDKLYRKFATADVNTDVEPMVDSDDDQDTNAVDTEDKENNTKASSEVIKKGSDCAHERDHVKTHPKSLYTQRALTNDSAGGAKNCTEVSEEKNEDQLSPDTKASKHTIKQKGSGYATLIEERRKNQSVGRGGEKNEKGSMRYPAPTNDSEMTKSKAEGTSPPPTGPKDEDTDGKDDASSPNTRFNEKIRDPSQDEYGEEGIVSTNGNEYTDGFQYETCTPNDSGDDLRENSGKQKEEDTQFMDGSITAMRMSVTRAKIEGRKSRKKNKISGRNSTQNSPANTKAHASKSNHARTSRKHTWKGATAHVKGNTGAFTVTIKRPSKNPEKSVREFTRQPKRLLGTKSACQITSADLLDETPYCKCKKPYYMDVSSMIHCSGSHCVYNAWIHKACFNIADDVFKRLQDPQCVFFCDSCLRANN